MSTERHTKEALVQEHVHGGAAPAATRPVVVPVWREVPADLDTPVSAYLKLARGRYDFLLESVEGGERLARYSFVGTEPYLVLRVRDGEAEWRWLAGPHAGTTERTPCADALAAVREETTRRPTITPPGLPPFIGGAVGYLAYEAAARYEPSIPIPTENPLGLPEAVFLFSETLLIFDHARRVAILLTHADSEATEGDEARAREEAEARLDALERRLRGPIPRARSGAVRLAASHVANGPSPRERGVPEGRGEVSRGAGVPEGRGEVSRGAGVPEGRSEVPASPLESRAAYEGAVERIKEYIRAGDCFQVVPSRRVARPTSAHPFAVYRALRMVNPSPYMFYLALDDFAVAGASPELLVRVRDGEVAIHPIAGTRRRDADPVVDAALEAELRADPKERAEHTMLVDLGRNDVGRVAEPGSVRLTQFLDIERYSHVMHLVSHVTGRLRAGLTAADALRAGFPAGTVSGAPKVRAMQVIAELERQKRGVYAGAVGYLGFDGALDSCIAIRTLVLKDGIAYAQAGGGIVADSEPEAEYQETENKLAAVLRALEEAERCFS